MITIDVDDNVVEVGDVVSGRVHWQVDERAPKAVTVELRYRTEGRGSEDKGSAAELVHPIPEDSTMTPPWLEFQFVVPAEGPVSYEGTLIRVMWAITVELDIPWARDEQEVEPIWVVPVNA